MTITNPPPAPSTGGLPDRLLGLGLSLAAILSIGCLVYGAWHLHDFLNQSMTLVSQTVTSVSQGQKDVSLATQLLPAQQDIARLGLLSCGMFIGMAIAFMGFALFLIGIRGEMNVEAQREKTNVKLARLSPGVFVILCATILVGLCATSRPEFKLKETSPIPATSSGASSPQGKAPPGKTGIQQLQRQQDLPPTQ